MHIAYRFNYSKFPIAMKRKKLEFTITVILYLSVSVISALSAMLILKGFSKLTAEFLQGNTWVNAIVSAVGAEFLTIFLALYDGKYNFEKGTFFRYVMKGIVGTLFFSGIWAVILLIQKNSITDSRYFFVLTALLHFALLTIGLKIIQSSLISHFYKGPYASLVAIATTEQRAVQVSEILKKDWSRRMVGMILLDGDKSCSESNGSKKNTNKSGFLGKTIDHIPVVADKEHFVEWVKENPIDEIFILAPNIEDPEITEAIENFVQMGISVHLNLPSVEHLQNHLQGRTKNYVPKTTERMAYLEHFPMLVVQQPEPKLRYLMLKRGMDIVGGIVGCGIAAVLFIIVGAAIKLESPGPVIFAQNRMGKNGRIFKMYKFRSMYQDAEARKAELMKQNEMSGLMFKIKDDPRITKVGRFIRKTSLDEFPQFFNVLHGDMSLVGTRPPTVNEFKEYSNYHKRRLSMKPGITGMWQVSGRSDIKDFEDVVKLDCEYIDNWSIWLDVKILFKTVGKVLKREGSS